MEKQKPAVNPLLGELLEKTCRLAWLEGTNINLEGCAYGQAHWGEGVVVTETSNYYRFLSGFVRCNNLRRVLEIGTHWGGSIRSMIRGLPDTSDLSGVTYVTSDIHYNNEEAFQDTPDNHIIRVTGDAAGIECRDKILAAFNNQPIDCLFIDAEHDLESTASLIDIFVPALGPRWLILDDIHLNDSMEQLWQTISAELGKCCFDATIHSRRGESGMGILHLRDEFNS